MITYSPVSLSRRHVLGDLYGRCDALGEQIPVYLAGETRELLGHVDESLGAYRDAFSFHLADDICKRLSAGQYSYSVDYKHTNPKQAGNGGRIELISITLNARKGYDKPVPKRAAATAVEAEVEK
jgi:hypothetical protein